MTKQENTEQKIIEAARIVFVQKGMYGARMQEIADEAGINKALLHYYFRSKDKLFNKIFEEALSIISSNIIDSLNCDLPIFEKLKKLIDGYFDMISSNPYLPLFVLNEINQNTERILKTFKNKPVENFMSRFFMELMKEVNNGKIRAIHPAHLMLNIISMIIFPFVVRPMIAPILKENLDVDFNDLLAERKKEIFEFVYNALKTEDDEK